MELYKLNFEESFGFKFKRDKGTLFIYDQIRKTFLVLTPEEWVRQHWVHYFHFIKGKSRSSLIVEKKIELYSTNKRIDLLVTEKTIPKILLECKAPEVGLNESHFEQIARYNSEIRAEMIVLSNGLEHLVAKYSVRGDYQFFPFSFNLF